MYNFISFKQYRLNETFESFTELKHLAKKLERVLLKSPNKRIFNIADAIDISQYNVIKPIFKLRVGIGIRDLSPLYSGAEGIVFTKDDFKEKVAKKTFNKIEIDLEKIRQEFDKIIIINDNIGKERSGAGKSSMQEIILHELQHVYDYTVSNGKFTSDKRSRDYYEYREKLGHAKNMFDDPELLKKYLSTYFEQNAFFSPVIRSLNFIDPYTIEINPLERIIEGFELYYAPFLFKSNLPKNDEKRIIRRLSQFYHRIVEKIEQELKDPTSKLSRYKKKYKSLSEKERKKLLFENPQGIKKHSNIIKSMETEIISRIH